MKFSLICLVCSIGTMVSFVTCGDFPVGGSRVIELYTPNSPLITFRIIFKTGSLHDPRGKKGLNALTALTIAQGGTKDFTYREFVEKLYPWAASISVQYDKELTTFIGEVHRDNLEKFYALFLEIILHPRFDPEDFQRNKEILINAITSTLRSNNDEELGKQALNYLIYEGHPYEHTEMGTETGLEAITLEEVIEHYKSRYTQNTITIGIAGEYPREFTKRVKDDFYSALPEGNGEETPFPEVRKIQGIEILIVEKESIATAISLGYPIDVTRSDKDFYALMIANSYFGEHRTFNGRLMNNMRQLRGLNYGDYSYIENFIQDGGTTFPVPNISRSQQFFSIWIRPVPHHNAHFALRQAVRELQMLIDRGISQEDFEETRDFLLNYSKLFVQTTSRRLGYIMDSDFYRTDYFIDTIRNELGSLTREDVNEAVKRHLQYNDIAVALVTPDAQDFRNRLISNTPSPITYNIAVTDEIIQEDKEIVSYELAVTPDRIRIVPVQQMFK